MGAERDIVSERVTELDLGGRSYPVRLRVGWDRSNPPPVPTLCIDEKATHDFGQVKEGEWVLLTCANYMPGLAKDLKSWANAALRYNVGLRHGASAKEADELARLEDWIVDAIGRTDSGRMDAALIDEQKRRLVEYVNAAVEMAFRAVREEGRPNETINATISGQSARQYASFAAEVVSQFPPGSLTPADLAAFKAWRARINDHRRWAGRLGTPRMAGIKFSYAEMP